MFDAPEVIKNIPDIKKIYEINDPQIEDLDTDTDQLDSDMFADLMSDDALKHWEAIYHIDVMDDESLDDRRTKVKGKMLERPPYSYRVLIRNLDNLLPSGYDLYISDDLDYIQVKVVLTAKYLLANVQKLLDDMVPLNMVLEVILKFNTYGVLGLHTHEELTNFTYQGLRDEPLIID